MTVRRSFALSGVVAIALCLVGCADEPDAPYPDSDFTFAGPYAVIGMGFDDSDRYFQQRSLVAATDGAMTGSYLAEAGIAPPEAGSIAVSYTAETGGAFTIIPPATSAALGRAVLQPQFSSLAQDSSLGIETNVASLLGGPATLVGSVHQPTGSVAYAGDFQSTNWQEIQLFVSRPNGTSYQQSSFAGRWAMATLYRYEGAFYSLIGYMDAEADGSVSYFEDQFTNSVTPTEPETWSGSRPANHWHIDSDGKMSYGAVYDGWVCGNNDVYFWDSIEDDSSTELIAPSIAIRTDVDGYQTNSLDGNYVFAGLIAGDGGRRSCIGGLINFYPDGLGWRLTGRENRRGVGPDLAVDLEGYYSISAAGFLRLFAGGTEVMRGYVGRRNGNGVADRAVAARLTTAEEYGMFFIGR